MFSNFQKISSVFVAFHLTSLLWASLPTFAESGPFGEIQGTLGKISCTALDNASVKLQLTKNGRALSLKKAKDIQRTNRKILKLLQKRLDSVKLITGNIGRSNGSFLRESEEATYEDLKAKQRQKLSRIVSQLDKLDISNTEFAPETPLTEVESEIEVLNDLIQEHRDLLDEASAAIRRCKGCAVDVIENIGRAQYSGKRPFGRTHAIPDKRKSTEVCSCYTISLGATYKFFAENNPSNVNQCNAPIYAQFEELENENRAVSWTVYYTFAEQEFTKAGEAPDFNDTDDLGFVYQVASGSHWIRLGSSGIDGSGPADCTSLKETAQSVYMEPLSVEVEICPLG
ncbi:MAG: hypothetical protein KDD70_04570 [Bdellovibrionales bacterium]|nr:hypothetical protein [Bdellovibrionales bacterium]